MRKVMFAVSALAFAAGASGAPGGAPPEGPFQTPRRRALTSELRL